MIPREVAVRIRFTSIAILFLALAAAAQVSLATESAPPAPTLKRKPVSIRLWTVPTLPKVDESDGDGFRARVSMKVQVQAEVTFADGSVQDVTNDAATLFLSTDDRIATVSRTGQVSFLSTKGGPIGAVGIMATHGEVGDVLNFAVTSANGTNQ